MRCFFLALILLISGISEAAPFYQQLEKKGLTQYWLKLLHYQKRLFGGYVSLVDSPEFFAHPDGKYDPIGELEATVALFSDVEARVGFFNHHPQCVFVERYRFLKKAGIVKTGDLDCPEFNDWKKGIGAKSVVLVFSSSFPNNPASIFGHTFIRFRGEEKHSLLDYSASYAALTEGEPEGLVYAIKGLLGSYKGVFSITPYYMKVNQYNNSQSRDLYEYELNISEAGVERIVNHLWELYSTAYFDYYFLDENCSYILSKVLELGNPEWNLSEIGRWYYLPGDSIKLATRIPDAVKNIHFRPSLKKQVIAQLNQLNENQQDRFFAVIRGELALKNIKNVNVLDALIVYWNFRKSEARGALPEEDKALFRQSLLQRAQIAEKSTIIQVDDDQSNRPEFGHEPSLISFGIGNIDNTTVYRLNIKSGLHDLLASDKGLEPFSQIDFLGLGVEYHPLEKRTNITQVTFIDIVSLHPYTAFDPRFSWQIGAHYGQIHDLKCRDCYKFNFDFGAGGSFYLAATNAVFYAMSGIFSETSEYFRDSQRFGPFVEVAVVGNFAKKYRFQIKQTIRADGLKDFPTDYYVTSSVGQSYAWSNNWEIRLANQFVSRYGSSEIQTENHELRLGYYF